MGFGLVFAGGGTKGSYEIGAWKAIKEMNIEVSAVAGASIGSINGALFVQNDFERAEMLWQRIKIDDVMSLNENVKTDNLFQMKNLKCILSEMYKNNGLDMSPLQQLLEEVIDEEKIRNSPIEYGLSTFSLTDRCEMELFKHDIPKGSLIEYIMASACFPGFKTRKIDDKAFIDGGVNNNMPISMLIQKGYKDIIAVDVGGFGIVKSFNITGANIISIRCQNTVIGLMEFEESSIKNAIKKGYYDTYRAFGRLVGKRYYFNTMSYYRLKMGLSDDLIDSLETAGEVFQIEKLAAYRLEDFIAGVLRGYNRANEKYQAEKATIGKQTLFDTLSKTKLDDSFIVAWLVDIIKSGNGEFMNNKLIMGLLGSNFNVASAIVYLTQ